MKTQDKISQLGTAAGSVDDLAIPSYQWYWGKKTNYNIAVALFPMLSGGLRLYMEWQGPQGSILEEMYFFPNCNGNYLS